MAKTPKSILVVGGAGYIGSHACKLASKRGYTPVVLDDLSTGHREFAKFGPFYEGKAEDSSLVQSILKKHSVTAVMHFGAKASVGESVENPLSYYNCNFVGTLKLLEAMLACNVRHFIFSSSCTTFGNPEKTPVAEGAEQFPVSPYGRTKYFVEEMLKDFDVAYKLKSVCLRYFNAAGADSEGELGENHDPETHLIPNALKASLGKSDSLKLFGNDYPTPDGTCIRDYIHVEDLADAHLLALEWLFKTDRSEDFNLGTEKGHSVLEVIQAIEKNTPNKVPYKIVARRPGDTPKLFADSTKAKKILGWKPRHDLNSIVKTAYDWIIK